MSVMRTALLLRLVVPALVLLGVPACSSGDGGTPVGEGLLPLQQDVPLGFDERGDGLLGGAFLDSAGSPVAIATLRRQPTVYRGTDPQPVPIQAFGPYGTVNAAALAPDDTLVVLGVAGEDAAVSIVRIAPDDSAQLLPLTGISDDARGHLMNGANPAGMSADGSTAVVATTSVDYSEGYPLATGEVQIWRVDTATGAITGSVTTRVADPAAAIPGEATLVAVRDTVVAPDGSAAVAVDVAVGDVITGQLIRLDAGFAAATVTQLQEAVPGEYDRHLAVDDAGTVYATTIEETEGEDGLSSDTLRVLALAPGETEPTTVVELEGEPSTTGLAVAPDGGRAYLTDLISGAGSGLSNEVSVIDLASGEKVGETVLCEEGRVKEAVPSTGGRLVVPGACGSEGEIHVWVLDA